MKESKLKPKSRKSGDGGFDQFFDHGVVERGPIVVKCGKPVLQVSYATIKFFTFLASTLLLANIVYCIKLLIKAIKIRTNIGYFINLISKPDGDILPTLQAIPIFIFLLMDILAVYFVYKLFSEKQQSRINNFLWALIMCGILMIVLTFATVIGALVHAYSEHGRLHDGMMDAMKVYSTNSIVKSQVDKLQIEFECCGSKKYEEWYEIIWYDGSLTKGGNGSEKSSTPFSCCSMTSLFPCVHHFIEQTGSAYLYTPEFNLSISTSGCFEMIKQRKVTVGWSVVGSLFLNSFLQGLMFICLRFIQTAHYERSKFEGSSTNYTVWIIGCYIGRAKNTQANDPPPVPPLPPELKQ